MIAFNNLAIIKSHYYHNTSSSVFYRYSLKWKHLLRPDKYKDVIIESLKFMVKEKRIEVNAFTIMSNYIHLTCLPAGRYGKFKVDMKEKLFKEIF